MLNLVIADARRLGLKHLNVSPVARNIEALGFFHDQGFKNVGHVQLFMDFSNRRWKRGLRLFDCDFEF